MWPIGWTTAGRIVFRTEAAPAGLWTISQTGGSPNRCSRVPGLRTRESRVLPGVSPDGSAVAFYDYEGPGRGGVCEQRARRIATETLRAIAFHSHCRPGSTEGSILTRRKAAAPVFERGASPGSVGDAVSGRCKRPPTRMFETMLRQTAGTPDVSWMPDNRRIIMAAASSTERSPALRGRYGLRRGPAAFRRRQTPDSARRFSEWEASGIHRSHVGLRRDPAESANGRHIAVIATPDSEDMPTWAMKAATMAYLTDRMGTPEIWLHQPRGSSPIDRL